ncbi:PaaI family thioesterase [Solicola sp. PLA-1-18]|uniref:PaaI family thioesterase n=1 Tax=Solicola sp. PLA-1-18 TaxID=3380532 RepID=UPI003B81C5BA
MSGLDFIRGLVSGEVPAPPFAALVGAQIAFADPGVVEFHLEPDESLMNPIGSIHGGALATILDSACGCACQTLLPQGVAYTTVDLQVRFHKAARPGSGTLRARAEIIHPGRRNMTAEAKVHTEDGTLIASATSGLLVISPPRQDGAPAPTSKPGG